MMLDERLQRRHITQVEIFVAYSRWSRGAAFGGTAGGKGGGGGGGAGRPARAGSGHWQAMNPLGLAADWPLRPAGLRRSHSWHAAE